ncbi:hypothetical protein WJX81_002675 [Elliptochloris bilobata]|uniref:ELYS-like domain-containing protein n=1 Tax=Elliptochloris bilobata TaxID=381761 RepID=A0AAW1QTX1_9CHLO
MAQPIAVLERLADTPPRELARTGADDRRVLHSLFLQCRAAGLTGAPGSNDVARLHALFDVALGHGLGSLVVDYVVEVCSDRFYTSSDALEAYLLDGECVKKWAAGALVQVHSWLSTGLVRPGGVDVGALRSQLGRTNSIVLVLRALAAPVPAPPAAAPPAAAAAEAPHGGDLEDALRLQQCLQVLDWCAAVQLSDAWAARRWRSEPEWRAAVSQRRGAAHPLPTFLQRLLQRLGLVGSAAFSYPPASLEKAVAGVFLSGGAGEATWQDKLALLLYLLSDAGIADLEAFRLGFSVPPAQLAEWHAAALVDQALAGPTERASLDTACLLLPGAATAGTPFLFVEALAKLGRPEEALAVLRALEEAETALQIRLDCGLITEAFLEARRCCDHVPAEQRGPHTRALVRRLAEWAQRARMVHEVIQLPLNALEEQAMCGWMEEQAAAGGRAAHALPVFYLLRGRIAEGLHANAGLSRTPPAEGDAEGAELARAGGPQRGPQWGMWRAAQAGERSVAESGAAKARTGNGAAAGAAFLATPGSSRRAPGSKRARLAPGAWPRSYRL